MSSISTILFDESLPTLTNLDLPIAVIGFGSQGRAQVLNLVDGWYPVVVGLRLDSHSRPEADKLGLQIKTPQDAAAACPTVVLLVPDVNIASVFGSILPQMSPDKALVLAGGYGYRFTDITIPEGVDAVMVAPNGPGQLVREEFLAERGVAAKVGIWQDATGRARERALAYARAIGAGRSTAGARMVEPALEAELDLFSEQTVLAGGAPLLAARAAQYLMRQGVPEDLAVLECVKELKLIADLLERYGVKETYQRISLTAAFGGLTRGNRVLADDLDNRMARIWGEIRSGEFTEEMKQWQSSGSDRKKLLNDTLGKQDI